MTPPAQEEEEMRGFYNFITDVALPLSALLFFIVGIIGFLAWIIRG